MQLLLSVNYKKLDPEPNPIFYIFQEADKWAFKQKQEKEMQEFLKRQKLEAQSFEQRLRPFLFSLVRSDLDKKRKWRSIP
jgi:hypothetical protein